MVQQGADPRGLTVPGAANPGEMAGGGAQSSSNHSGTFFYDAVDVGNEIGSYQDAEGKLSIPQRQVIQVPAMASAYDQEALIKSHPQQQIESLVSFDGPAHFKKGTTSDGWISMGGIGKAFDVKSLATNEHSGEA